MTLRVIDGQSEGYQPPERVKAFNRRILAAFASAPADLTPHEGVRVLLENAAEIAMANGASANDFMRGAVAIYETVRAHGRPKDEG